MLQFLKKVVLVVGGVALIATGVIRLANGGMAGANAGQELLPQFMGMALVLFGAIAIKKGWDRVFPPS